MQAAVRAIEYALPEGILDNDTLAAEFPGWTADKIESKIGVRQRHIAAPGECASDLAVAAARKLFAAGACKPEEIDYVLLCTQSPDYLLPTTACLVQARLGLPTRCGALDVNLGCSGFIYSLGLAKGLVETGQAHHVLLLTAETYSKHIHPGDKSVRTLFGDAAAATLVSAMEADRPFIGPFVYGTDGRGAENLIVPTGGARASFVPEAAVEEDENGNRRTVNDLYMNGAEIFNFTLRAVPAAFTQLLEKTGLSADSVDYFVFHQANRYMLEHLRRKLKLPAEKFCIDLEECGNTVSASIPIALKRAVMAGHVHPGDRVMLLGFGVGYSWSGALLHWINQ